MGIKTRSNYATGASKLSNEEWNKLIQQDKREIENHEGNLKMSDALTDIENGNYFNNKKAVDLHNEKVIDKVINNNDMYEYHANETLQITLRIMNAFSIINLPITKETAFEFLKALELENIVILEK